MRTVHWLKLILLLVFFQSCQEKSREPLPETADSPVRSPEEELLHFQVDAGFDIQLVASEPMVESPVMIQFDEDGRMWVVEMRGYMTDMEGSEEPDPIGRITILEDRDGDGVMDQRTVYLDSLVMPRTVTPFGRGALVVANQSLWLTEDSKNGDWIADSMILLDSTYAASANPEHTDNGMLRNLDNWYYSAKSRLRYRHENGEWIRDTTEFRGQWGISQDDEGRLLYNYNWSQLHGDLVPPNSLTRNPNHNPSTGIDHGLTIDRKVYPIRKTLAVNRGYIPGVLDSLGRLLEFTSAGGPVMYRSRLFPEEYYGNVFVMESAGNLVKRNEVTQKGATLEAHDPNPGREFMASTDERFRPVYGAVGPDGALYIVDMYQGIIQHETYMTPYLTEQTLERHLEAPAQMGRIWRVAPKGSKPQKAEKLSQKSPEDLIIFLGHSDAYYREQAQRLIVEKGGESVAERLIEIAIDPNTGKLLKTHALYTLEGMGFLDPGILLTALESPDYQIQAHVLRLLEGFGNYPHVKEMLGDFYEKNAETDSEILALQMALSSYTLVEEDQFSGLTSILKKYGNQALFKDAVMSGLENREYDFLEYLVQNWKESNPDREIFIETLTASIIQNQEPNEIIKLLALIEENKGDWKGEIALAGLSIQAADSENLGKIKFSQKPDFFKKEIAGLDSFQLTRVQRLFSWPGYSPESLASGSHNLEGNALELFASGRQKFLASCAGCHGSNGKGVDHMGPPLVGSEWVLGDERQLALILLHGIEGPITVRGKVYDEPEILPVMPSHSTMDDGNIAAILTYIRNEWGNQADPITRQTVGGVRHSSQGRVYPWSVSELVEHMKTLNETKP